MAILSVGPVRLADYTDLQVRISDPDQFADFIRRVQTPYYEQARRDFNTQEVQDRFSDTGETLPYLHYSLQGIIELA